ncbi:MAG: polyketide cyclase [Nocardioides sp.]|nr:polyketide cyclase [Nocardioides sp.]
MTPTDLLGTRDQHDLVFTRTFAAPLEDVWAACTEPARMERWIGTWTGDPAAGEVAFRMTAEGDDVPEEVYVVEACEPPRRFVVRSRDAASFSADGSGPQVHWQHTLELTEADGVTTLTFRQVVPEGPVGAEMVASVGPGWDYYLDRLVTSYAGDDLAAVVFEAYLGRSEHYRGLFG